MPNREREPVVKVLLKLPRTATSPFISSLRRPNRRGQEAVFPLLSLSAGSPRPPGTRSTGLHGIFEDNDVADSRPLAQPPATGDKSLQSPRRRKQNRTKKAEFLPTSRSSRSPAYRKGEPKLRAPRWVLNSLRGSALRWELAQCARGRRDAPTYFSPHLVPANILPLSFQIPPKTLKEDKTLSLPPDRTVLAH